MNSMDFQSRTFRDLDDAVAKMPCNLKTLTDFLLDGNFPGEDRVDFMHALAGQKHPSIKYILQTLRDRDDGILSHEAGKILKRYSTGREDQSYNNVQEAISELPPEFRSLARRVVEDRVSLIEKIQISRTLAETRHPAAFYIMHSVGFRVS